MALGAARITIRSKSSAVFIYAHSITMSRLDSQQPLMPSMLDRLIDPDSGGTVAQRGYSISQMVEAVQRDLEDLLNTRQTYPDMPEAFTEVARSIVGYGLPDLVSFNAVSPQQCLAFGRILEQIVSNFEPRLRDVRATMVDPGGSKERRVQFRVEARLCVDPAPEVAFDTVLELATGHYSVQQSGT
jgi:type VI secretion system protein ImpF